MTNLRSQSPSPRERFCRPSYPRLIGLGVLVLTTACGGNVSEPSSPDGTGGTGASDGGAGGTGATGGTGGYGASAGGTGGITWDAAAPQPDAAVEASPDAEPPPDGDIAPPWDAGQEGWDAQIDADPPDADMAGGEPAPFDAGSCEASIEPY